MMEWSRVLTLMYSIGQTHVASTPPAMQPAVMAVKGLFLVDMVLLLLLTTGGRDNDNTNDAIIAVCSYDE
jgi:hypothetical protein